MAFDEEPRGGLTQKYHKKPKIEKVKSTKNKKRGVGEREKEAVWWRVVQKSCIQKP